MTLAPPVKSGNYRVVITEPDDFDFWRDRARLFVRADVSPEHIIWQDGAAPQDLFSQGEEDTPRCIDAERTVRASKQFVELARMAICHSDPDRFSLLYRILWRLQANPRLLEDRADTAVRRLDELARTVRRDIHKMRAFVRFRRVEAIDSDREAVRERYVAWFEPEHHILRANAGFFVRRFAQLHWSILTPKGSLHWDGSVLAEGPPAQRSDAPDSDPTEDLWRTYYSSIFNPARLKIGAMLKEMPRKYWNNMPEAALIPELVAGAQAREARMVESGAMEETERPGSRAAIREAVRGCKRCPIGDLQNQAVPGEGPKRATLMIVGEQPGDQEDHSGRPFVGPAGQLLDRHLAQAGIDRSRAYVTNAVKHFKFVQQGKRRLHQSPTAREIDVCRWWLESERALVKPQLVLALGASAARGLLGKTVSISKARGQPFSLEDGSELWVTVHPSYLLRLTGPAQEEQERLFAKDLAAVTQRLVELQRS